MWQVGRQKSQTGLLVTLAQMKSKAMHLCQVARLEDPEISAEKREGRSLQKPESLKSAVNGEPREGSLQESAVYGFKEKSRQSRQSTSTGTPRVDDKRSIVMILTAGLYNKSHTSLSHVASMALHIKQIALGSGYHYSRLWSSKDDSSSDDDSETHVKALCYHGDSTVEGSFKDTSPQSGSRTGR